MSKRTNTPARLLVVARDIRYGEWLRHHLGVFCPEAIISVLNLREFERWSEEIADLDCDVLLLATGFGTSPEDPAAQGLEMLRRLRRKRRFPVLVAVAEEGNELTAVRALQLGAVDYLPKRLLTPERLGTSVKLALRRIEKLAARRYAEPAPSIDAKSGEADIKASTPTNLAEAAAKPAIKPQPVEAKAAVTAGPAEPDATPATPVQPADADAALADLDLDSAAITAGNLALSEPVIATHSAFLPYGADFVAPGYSSELLEADPWRPDTPAARPQTATTNTPTASAASTAPTTDTAPAAKANAEPAVKSDQPTDAPPSPVDHAAHSQADVPAAESASGVDPEPMSVRPDFLPGYTIHGTVGESEKATVYVATSATLGRKVALKVSKTLRDEAAGRQFLEREYTAIVAIRNPYVVQIYDYGVHGGYEYLVMEYLPSGDLKARMQQGVSEQQALWYVEQIAKGLRVVHHAGLLHRDLKPPNVMLRENGDVALIDFGLARALDGSTPSTRIGVLRGSPYYMSPEQALGEQLDVRSDFYSLGIIFYEMLTGRKPYTGSSAMEVLQQHVNAPVPQLPKALAQHNPLLAKLLAKTREERFSSASEVIAAVVTTREIAQVESSAA